MYPKLTRQLLLIPLITLFTTLLLPCPSFAQEGGDSFAGATPTAQTVAMAINQMRTQAGLPPLALNPLLNLAAQNHVNDMLVNYNYGHYGSDGSTVHQRVQRTGYAASTWVSENWVMVSDPNMAIQWWMNSYVHRNNILNPNWHELGIGGGYQQSNAQHIFVAVFTAGESGDSVIAMPPEPEPVAIPAGGLQYQIQPGDTLLSIGLRYGVEWPILARANNLSEFSLLQIGQVIRIPGVENVGGYISDAQPTVVSAASSSNENTFVRRYTVQPGDTLARVAAIYEISWQALANENGLGEYSVLSIGQELRIPGAIARGMEAADSQSAGPQANDSAPSPDYPATYTIQAGDTIISIAMRYQLDWHELLRMNQLTEHSMLNLGETIRLR